MADALGARWEGSNLDPGRVDYAIESSDVITPWTDDTQMALSIVEILERFGAIDQQELAKGFARRYEEWRGYGPGIRVVLSGLRQGIPWRYMRERVFRNGSFGNGSAMRAAPIGAYYYDASSDVVVAEAARSAEITHSHPEGVASAEATALASWLAARSRDEQPQTGAELLTIVANRTSNDLDVTSGLWRAAQLPHDTPLNTAVSILGNGSKVTCQDTVPLALWIALNHLDDYEKAIRLAIAAGGDTDTIAAIAGGIIGARLGIHGIPEKWLAITQAVPFIAT